MWHLLHSFRTDGYHFRKQARLGRYVVDFACLHAGLVIEVDGVTHNSEIAQSNDAVRDDYLRGRGFTVLRFASEDVMRNEEGVCRMVTDALDGKRRNHRGSSPPSRASLGPAGPSSATLPARGRVGAGAQPPPQNPTSPLAGEVAKLGPQDRSAARRGGVPRSNDDEDPN